MARTTKFTPELKAATKLIADKISSAGFKVLSSGYGAVVVLHNGGKTSSMVRAETVDEFIRTAAR